MKVHYLEIVSLDVDAICKAYEATHNVTFGEADALLGFARTCTLPDGSIIGVRAPLRDNENPVVRPYWLVEDLEKAVATVEAQGAEIAVPPMEIPGKGATCSSKVRRVEFATWRVISAGASRSAWVRVTPCLRVSPNQIRTLPPTSVMQHQSKAFVVGSSTVMARDPDIRSPG